MRSGGADANEARRGAAAAALEPKPCCKLETWTQEEVLKYMSLANSGANIDGDEKTGALPGWAANCRGRRGRRR
eukprot:8987701-Pyramimonas_sp.AAC.1